METKVCSKCGEEKTSDMFYRSNRYNCKKCIKNKNKEYYSNNAEKIIEKHKEYYSNNAEKIIEKHKEYRKTNKERRKETVKKYKAKNKKKIREWNREYEKHLRKTDVKYKIKQILRNRINNALVSKNASKNETTEKLVGCTYEHLVKHLEEQFTEGMSWDNHSLYGWHIDHIIPCCKFDLSKPEEQKKCFHYTNLQPLWAKDNLEKGDKII
jgi:signal recognition particle GTPase